MGVDFLLQSREVFFVGSNAARLSLFALNCFPNFVRFLCDFATVFIQEIPTIDTIASRPCSICSLGGEFVTEEESLSCGSHLATVHLLGKFSDSSFVARVVCEKLLCFTSEEAEELVALAKEKNRVVGVTYGYSGHQMIQQARQMSQHGDLGDIRVINMSFAFGGYNYKIEETNPAAKWRFDPTKAGPSFALGDVGTHPLFIIEAMIPDMKIDNLMCTKDSFVEGRELEDNAFVIMRLKGSKSVQEGAKVYCWASSINCGARHGHKIRVVGSKASIEWDDERPNQMTYEIEGEPVRTLERGAGYLYPEARVEDRIGGGHAEGLFEAWANLYRRFAVAMDAANNGEEYGDFWYPNVESGAQGVKWIEKCVESANNGACWVDYE